MSLEELPYTAGVVTLTARWSGRGFNHLFG
jgi:hypothetical protein